MQIEEMLLIPKNDNWAHIDQCPVCSKLYQDLKSEQDIWTEVLYPNELTDTFTSSLLQQINDLDADRIVKKNRLGRKRWIAASIAVAGCAFMLIMTQPTVAEMLRSLFTQSSGVDSGLLEADRVGIVHNPKVRVTDKGYTLEIDEVVADSTRLVIAIKITDSEGSPRRDLMDWSRLQITDSSGDQVARLQSYGGAESFDKLTYIFPQEIDAEVLTVKGDVTELGNRLLGIPFVEGNWSFDFDIDMRKANALKNVQYLNQSFTSSEGFVIDMTRLVRSPSGVRLEFTTKLTGDLLVRVPEQLLSEQRLMYHFEDEAGQIISAVNWSKPHEDSLIAQHATRGSEPGTIHWTYTFSHLPIDEGSVRFVLDGYSLPLFSNSKVVFKPADLQDNPVTFTDQGDELTLLRAEIASDPNQQQYQSAGILYFEGVYKNNATQDVWKASDGKGLEYNVTVRGGRFESNEKIHVEEAMLIIEGLEEWSDDMTLIRTITDKRFMDNAWIVNLSEVPNI